MSCVSAISGSTWISPSALPEGFQTLIHAQGWAIFQVNRSFETLRRRRIRPASVMRASAVVKSCRYLCHGSSRSIGSTSNGHGDCTGGRRLTRSLRVGPGRVHPLPLDRQRRPRRPQLPATPAGESNEKLPGAGDQHAHLSLTALQAAPQMSSGLEPAATLEEEEQRCEHEQLRAEPEADERFPAADVSDHEAEVLSEKPG